MDLKNQNGFELVKTEDIDKLKEIQAFIPIVRNSVSKAWRLMDKLLKMLEEKK